MKADAVKCRPFTCVSCQVPQFCLSASRSLRRLIPKSKSRENAVYRYKAIVVNTPYRKNTLSQKVLASLWGAGQPVTNLTLTGSQYKYVQISLSHEAGTNMYKSLSYNKPVQICTNLSHNKPVQICTQHKNF